VVTRSFRIGPLLSTLRGVQRRICYTEIMTSKAATEDERPEAPYRVAVATSAYRSAPLITHSGLAPVRITRGGPRFRLGYRLAASVMDLAPTREMLRIEDEAAFSLAYRARLDEIGVNALGARFTEVARATGTSGVVLLCFEDIVGQEEWCHRRIFAQWWEERTGQIVPELGMEEGRREPAA
jgi:hypothetical protein